MNKSVHDRGVQLDQGPTGSLEQREWRGFKEEPNTPEGSWLEKCWKREKKG